MIEVAGALEGGNQQSQLAVLLGASGGVVTDELVPGQVFRQVAGGEPVGRFQQGPRDAGRHFPGRAGGGYFFGLAAAAFLAFGFGFGFGSTTASGPG